MRAVLSPPEPDGQILYRPYMDSYKRTPKTEVCQVLFAFHDHYTLCLPGNQLWKPEKYKKLCQKREKRLKDCKKMVDIVSVSYTHLTLPTISVFWSRMHRNLEFLLHWAPNTM